MVGCAHGTAGPPRLPRLGEGRHIHILGPEGAAPMLSAVASKYLAEPLLVEGRKAGTGSPVKGLQDRLLAFVCFLSRGDGLWGARCGDNSYMISIDWMRPCPELPKVQFARGAIHFAPCSDEPSRMNTPRG